MLVTRFFLLVLALISIPGIVFAENLVGGNYEISGGSINVVSGAVTGGSYTVGTDMLSISGAVSGGNYAIGTGYEPIGSAVTPTPRRGGGGGGSITFSGNSQCQLFIQPAASSYPGAPVSITLGSRFSSDVFLYAGLEYKRGSVIVVYPTQTTTYQFPIKNSTRSCSAIVPVTGTITAIADSDPAARSSVCKPPFTTYRKGQRSDGVRSMQEFLRDQGYFTGAIDGYYWQSTIDAVARFQRAQQIQTNAGNLGLFGPATRDAANRVYCGRAKKVPVVKPAVSTNTCLAERINVGTLNSNKVRQIQKFLISQGYTNVRVTGHYLVPTYLAIRQFQEKYADEILAPQGFKRPTGIWGVYTARKASQMGLCQVEL